MNLGHSADELYHLVHVHKLDWGDVSVCVVLLEFAAPFSFK